MLEIIGYRPLTHLNREDTGETRASLKSGRMLPFHVLRRTSAKPEFSPMLQGIRLSSGTATALLCLAVYRHADEHWGWGTGSLAVKLELCHTKGTA